MKTRIKRSIRKVRKTASTEALSRSLEEDEMNHPERIPTIEHAGELEDMEVTPAYVMPDHEHDHPQNGRYSCCFCGVGDSGKFVAKNGAAPAAPASGPEQGEGVVRVTLRGETVERPATAARRRPA